MRVVAAAPAPKYTHPPRQPAIQSQLKSRPGQQKGATSVQAYSSTIVHWLAMRTHMLATDISGLLPVLVLRR
jgi:hypothetical protein